MMKNQILSLAITVLLLFSCSSSDDSDSKTVQIQDNRILGVWEQVDECFYNNTDNVECYGLNITYDYIELKANGDFISFYNYETDNEISNTDSFEFFNNELVISQKINNEPVYIEYSKIIELTETSLKIETYKNNDGGEFEKDQIDILYFEKV